MHSWLHRTRLWSFIQNLKTDREISALKNCPNCWRSASEPNFAPLVNISKHLQKSWNFTDMHSWLHRTRLWSFIQNLKTDREISTLKIAWNAEGVRLSHTLHLWLTYQNIFKNHENLPTCSLDFLKEDCEVSYKISKQIVRYHLSKIARTAKGVLLSPTLHL